MTNCLGKCHQSICRTNSICRNEFCSIRTLHVRNCLDRFQLLATLPPPLMTENRGIILANSACHKRFCKGFQGQMSYTLSKWIQATEYLNAADAFPTKMIGDQDVPHRLSFNFTYCFHLEKVPNLLMMSVVL